MEVKKKDMQKTGWKRCLQKAYISKPVMVEGIKGVVSLSILKKLTGPLIIHYEFGDVKIADNGYKHLQIALEDNNFWLTAMYDDKNELIELYFDITNGNYFDDLDNPYFYDLFLDIVVTREKKIYIVDKDELDLALKEKAINTDEYNKAQKTCEMLYNYLNINKEKVINDCYKYLKILQKKINV